MSENSSEEIRLMVNICKMYFLQELSQQQIADHLYISRSQVSKLIARAKRGNVFSIQINDPFAEEEQVAARLKDRFGVDGLVIDTRGSLEPLRMLADGLSRMVTPMVTNGSVIGVSAGTTVAVCSAYTSFYNCNDLLFVPLVAGQSYEGEAWYANNNCRRFSERHPSRYLILNVPLVVRSRELRVELEANESIKPVLDRYEELGALLLGIGQATQDSTLSRCPVTRRELERVANKGVRAVIGASFIDEAGVEYSDPKCDFLIGIKAEQIKKCPKVIGIATGLGKVEAIRASLIGGYLNTLCTDLVTAKALLAS